jgi:superfamily II DNA/RNA helicase
MLFSATLDNAVDVLARRFLDNPVHHAVDSAAPPVQIEHHLLTVVPADRVGVVRALTGGDNRSLIFTRTKHGAQKLARQLTGTGVPAAELHGNLSQNARTRNLASFSSGAVRVLVATDIAARGIHVDGIDLVIHADTPVEHKAYLHRSGRTARAGAAGVVITLQTPAQAREVHSLMKRANVVPLAATVSPGSPLLRSISGPPAKPIAPVPPTVDYRAAAPAAGHGAVAMSAGYRGRRRR